MKTITNKGKRPKGRPKGHKLSAESKDKIRKSKMGHRPSAVTKLKISIGVKRIAGPGSKFREALIKHWAENPQLKQAMSIHMKAVWATVKAQKI